MSYYQNHPPTHHHMTNLNYVLDMQVVQLNNLLVTTTERKKRNMSQINKHWQYCYS